MQLFSVLGTTVLTEGKHVSFSNSLVLLIVANAVGYLGYVTHGFLRSHNNMIANISAATGDPLTHGTGSDR
jgi:hypothetical protein